VGLGCGLEPSEVETVEDPGADPDQQQDGEVEDSSHVRKMFADSAFRIGSVSRPRRGVDSLIHEVSHNWRRVSEASCANREIGYRLP